ncbi:MAG: polyphosphate kinase 2 family protein [Anaerolineae bacterium]|nr:polyphosphate kinase 2 family protein [Anaerolineae bacterium]
MTEQWGRVPFGDGIRLADVDADDTGPFAHKREAKAQLKANVKRMNELQELLYAEGKHALLIVLQAMDAGGKDSTIRHVMDGFNPQGCHVAGFKVPTERELAQDFLWRIHPHTPQRGHVSIFNRSHYEDVLVVRVEQLAPEEVWRARYEHINAFERLLADSGVTILKFYLHISKDEQRERFEERLQRKEKNWKFSLGDLETRSKWDDYMSAFEEVFARCNHPWAPWYVVPANKKWYRNWVVSSVIVDALERMKMRYPPAPEGLEDVVIE